MPGHPSDDISHNANNFSMYYHPENLQNDNKRDYEWNGLVLLAAVVSIFIVFIITLIVYYIYFRLYSNRLEGALQRRHRRRRMSSYGHRLSWRVVRDYYSVALPADQGLSRAVLNALPVFVYKAEDFEDALRCAVCLCEFEENEKGTVLPNCDHRFHADCIDMWFYTHSTCPLCRQEVGPLQPENGHVVVEVLGGREEHGDGTQKGGGGDASVSAELGKNDSHCIKDVEDESRANIAIR